MDTSIYSMLALLNTHLCEAREDLQRLRKVPVLKGLRSETYDLQLEEVRAGVSEFVMEALSQVELRNAARFWRKRRAIENRWKGSGGGKEAPAKRGRAKTSRGLGREHPAPERGGKG